MGSYALVHSLTHMSWCWERVVPLLEGAGHEVVLVDLSGVGEQAVSTSRLTEETTRAATRTVLVGYSFQGLSAVEVNPDLVGALVYLATGPADVERFADRGPGGVPRTIPRHYILATSPRAAVPLPQERLPRAPGSATVHRIRSGPAPFAARPYELAASLLDVGDTVFGPARPAPERRPAGPPVQVSRSLGPPRGTSQARADRALSRHG